MNPDFWGIFHDGHIWKIEGDISRDITLHISVLYLREMFSGEGAGFKVYLSNCELVEYTEYGEEPTQELNTIAERRPEILYVNSTNPIILDCTMGTLKLRYYSASVFLDSGEPVSYDALVSACTGYWEVLKRKSYS